MSIFDQFRTLPLVHRRCDDEIWLLNQTIANLGQTLTEKNRTIGELSQTAASHELLLRRLKQAGLTVELLQVRNVR